MMNASMDPLVIGRPLNSVEKGVVVLFAHGLGDTGEGWRQVASCFEEEQTWVLPTAPTQPVSINMGMSMPSWFDIKSSGMRDLASLTGFVESRAYINDLLVQLATLKRPLVLGGFSQGGALALSCAYSFTDVKLSGVMAISTYCPTANVVLDVNKMTPLQQMHGLQDDMISHDMGKAAFDGLSANGVSNARWISYPRLGHSIDMNSVRDMDSFLKKCGGPNVASKL